MQEGIPGHAEASVKAEIEHLVRSLQTTRWDTAADKIRLRKPTFLGWTIVRSEPFDAAWHHDRLHLGAKTHQSSRDRQAVGSEALTPSMPMAAAIRPFLDFGQGVAEVSPSLVKAWQQPLASIYFQATRNLRLLLDTKLTATSVHGCPMRILDAGFWTTGSVFDFEFYLSRFDNYPVNGLTTDAERRTLLIGSEQVIWCEDHSLDPNQLKACSLVIMRDSLTCLSSATASKIGNRIKPGRIL